MTRTVYLTALGLCLVFESWAAASTINVTSSCTFASAVAMLNAGTNVGSCGTSGTGAPTAIQVASGTFPVTGSGVTIQRSATISGAGLSATTIQFNGNVGASLLTVNSGIAVTITNLTLRGTAGSAHVGLANFGQANLTSVRVTNCGSDGISQFGVMSLDSCKVDLNGRDRPFVGGGMNIQGDSTIVDRTSITDNKAARGGGICLIKPGVGKVLIIHRSLIANNTASENGGGVYAEGELEMVNTTVTGNSAASHGGGFRMESTGDELHIQQSTIARNTASTGGGLSVNAAGVSTPAIAFNIFANNTATSNVAPDVEWAPNSLSQNYNLIKNPSGWVSSVFPSYAGNKIGVDPGLGTLQNLGGPTSVLPITTASPAFNAIPSGSPLAPEDQRGLPRPRRGAYDMGAFELQ